MVGREDVLAPLYAGDREGRVIRTVVEMDSSEDIATRVRRGPCFFYSDVRDREKRVTIPLKTDLGLTGINR